MQPGATGKSTKKNTLSSIQYNFFNQKTVTTTKTVFTTTTINYFTETVNLKIHLFIQKYHKFFSLLSQLKGIFAKIKF